LTTPAANPSLSGSRWGRFRGLLAAGLLLGGPRPALAQAPVPRTKNVVLVTLDGVRWQEIFDGADARQLGPGAPPLAATAARRRQALLPFVWGTVAAQGQLYGNRAYGNRLSVANFQHFSYPGYQELLTGFANPRIHSNAPVDKYPSTISLC